MKRLKALAFVVLVASLAVPTAFAQTCPTPPQGPYYIGSFVWYEYSPDPACVSAHGGLSPTTLWCYDEEGFETLEDWFSYQTYTFTADVALDSWDADAYVEFVSNSANDWFQIWAGVKHNNVTTWTMLYDHDGTDGWVSCQRLGGYFDAEAGDEITITIYSAKANGNATIEISTPNIFTSL